MGVVVSHPTGNQNVRALISALSKGGFLSEFHTGLAMDTGSNWSKILPKAIKRELLRRSFPIPAFQTHTHPLLELARMIVLKAGLKKSIEHEVGWASIDSVYKSLDKKVASRLTYLSKKNKADAIYAYEDGAKSSFEEAKRLNIECLYELPIGYWRAAKILLKEEKERWPDWAATLTGFQDSEQKLERKDEELRLADKIFVASQFTAKTLKYYPGALSPVKVIPYGFPAVTGIRNYNTAISTKRPLKLLFVGGLSQRKGIADLFAAVDAFKHHVTLTVVGNKGGENCPALNEALAKHLWIPGLPHQGILKIMQEHDVLVFPSLFEGFGLVITEAMAQGTPVITTDRTAGPDIIKSGENGWLIESGSTDSLIKAIEQLLVKPHLIGSVGKAATEMARRRPWETYGQEMLNAIITDN